VLIPVETGREGPTFGLPFPIAQIIHKNFKGIIFYSPFSVLMFLYQGSFAYIRISRNTLKLLSFYSLFDHFLVLGCINVFILILLMCTIDTI
jgi:hypothetical protein